MLEMPIMLETPIHMKAVTTLAHRFEAAVGKMHYLVHYKYKELVRNGINGKHPGSDYSSCIVDPKNFQRNLVGTFLIHRGSPRYKQQYFYSNEYLYLNNEVSNKLGYDIKLRIIIEIATMQTKIDVLRDKLLEYDLNLIRLTIGPEKWNFHK